jgi:hypothetical protein
MISTQYMTKVIMVIIIHSGRVIKIILCRLCLIGY